MRASEALMLGSLVVKPMPFSRHYSLDNGKEGGCALGMISKANGLSFFNAELYYPWIQTTKVVLECGCFEETSVVVGIAIAHLFDTHIILLGDWTLERLAEWLDSVDPTPREDKCLDKCLNLPQSQFGSSPVQSLVRA